MLATYLAVAAVVAASFAVGAALLKLCGRDPRAGYGPAVGFAALLIAATLAIKLPGDGKTAAIVLLVLTLASLAFAGRDLGRPSGWLVLAGAAALFLISLPFLATGRVDLLGVGINNDTNLHLAWIEGLATGSKIQPVHLPIGYPLGDHALAATVASGLGTGQPRALTALLMAVPLLTLPAALPVLKGLSPPRRALGALLVAVPYLAAAYYAEAAFKETIEALFLLAFVVLMRELGREGWSFGGVLLLGLLLAGTFYNYSYIGLAWPLAALGTWGLLAFAANGRPPRALIAEARERVKLTRRMVVAILAAVLVVGVVLAPEAGRAQDFFRQVKLSPSGQGKITTANVGNLVDQISPFQVLGLWPREDFRLYYGNARSGFKGGLLAALGLLAFAYAAAWWLRRRDFALPGAVLAGLVIFFYLKGQESAYVAAKSLAVLGPLVMLLIARALFEPLRAASREIAWGRAALVAVFAGAALWSSSLALRGGLTWANAHRDQIESLRPLTRSSQTLFLGREDYVHWELRGTPVSDKFLRSTVKLLDRTEKIPVRVPARGSPYATTWDFDTLRWPLLDYYTYVITTATSFASEPPPNFELVRDTGAWKLWKRTGRTPHRLVLPERSSPGALLDCTTPAGLALSAKQGYARIRARPRRTAERFQVIPAGKSRSRSLDLERGRWELSLQYISQYKVRVFAGGKLLATIPASSDRAGPVWRVGTVPISGPGRLKVRLEPVKPSFLAATSREATFGDLDAVRTDVPAQTVPLSKACGQYVDWYTLGTKRPRG